MGHIRAAICFEHGKDLCIDTVDLRPPLGREVEVTLAACAICHSDIAYLDGGWGGFLPAVYGHEASGYVSAVGPEVRGGVAVGDAVIVTLLRACGTCACCQTGAPAHCATPYDRTAGPLSLADGGGPLEQGMSCGAFAEKVVVDQSQIARVPDDMPMDTAALLACGVITGLGAVVNTAQVRPGQTVVVIGAGGVGLNAIQGARLAGAARIIAVDRLESKLDTALAFGATDAILGEGAAPWDEVARLTDGAMAHAVFVSVGAIPVVEQARNYLSPLGTAYIVGLPHSGAMAQIEPVMYGTLGQGVRGSKMGDVVLERDIPWIIDLYQQGRLKLDELVSGRWRLDQINEAIADTRSGAARRNVIMFDR